MTDTLREKLLDAALPHVPFDGWSEVTFKAAAADLEAEIEVAKAACPRGALDLAVTYHRRGDAAMVTAMQAADFAELRFREKVAEALKLRVAAMDDREAVRRASALFALPQNAADGAALVWETADKVWTALGDTSTDVNWYTKRATLSGVWASTVLYWLGDDSDDAAATGAFIDRRIDNVMQIEKMKAAVKKSPLAKPFLSLQDAFFGKVKAPDMSHLANLPGRWTSSGPSEN